MKGSRTLATLVSVSLLAVGIGPIAVAAPQSVATSIDTKAPLGEAPAAPMVRGFIVQAEGQALLSLPTFATGSSFAGKSLTWSKGLGSLGRTLRLDSPVSGATAKRMIAELKSQLGTDAVYPDQKFGLLTTESQSGATWGLDRIDQVDLPLSGSYEYASTGAGVTAFIVDTGTRDTHNDFGGRVTSGWTAYSGDPATLDCHGHGTHVAGTVGGATYGVAKDVTIVPIKVFSCAGDGAYTSDIAAGINWAAGQHADNTPAVMNLSLGGGYDSVLNAAIRTAVNDGITVAVASGNEAADACYTSPASEPLAITVNASTSDDNDASFSNYGACTDIYAPGVNILSAGHSSNSGLTTMSGTSMASPHVAGAAARILEDHPTYTPAQVWAELQNQATAIDWYYTAADAKILLHLDAAEALAELPLSPVPTVSGLAQTGETLTATVGSWTTDTSLSYQWLRGSTSISGANDTTYTLTSSDNGQKISFRVTGTLSGYLTTSRTSAQTATVQAAFSVSSIPSISGTVAVGQTLGVVTGSWTPSPNFAYQWFCNDTAINRATSSTLKLSSSHNGCQIKVRVTGSARNTVSKVLFSNSVGPVEVVELSFVSSPNPSISGTARVGKTLKVSTGTWSPKPKFTYQWYREGTPISGATKSSYKLVAADQGALITVSITATLDGYAATSRTSAATSAVLPK